LPPPRRYSGAMDAEASKPTERQTLWLGVRLYAGVGLGFVVVYFVLGGGPWKMLSASIAVVCVVRAGWYYLKIRRLPDGAAP